MYSVTFLGENIGIVKNKEEIKNAIEEYLQNKTEDIAYISLSEMPEFEFKFIDSKAETNEEEILVAIEKTATITYKRYAVTLDGMQKAVVSTLDEAKQVVEEIKAEFEGELDLNLAVSEVYDSDGVEIESIEAAVATLNSDSTLRTKIDELKSSVNGVILHLPISENVNTVITSRFGTRSSGYHTGLDIAANTGTDIYAVASGTVTFAGWSGNYGNLVIITHENGVQTYYAHCSKIYASVGDTVKTGDVISAVGSTGNSTGPHLHLEVRVNGEIQNPQNYLYN